MELLALFHNNLCVWEELGVFTSSRRFEVIVPL